MKTKVKTIAQCKLVAIIALSAIFTLNIQAQKQDNSTKEELFKYFKANVAQELKPLRTQFDTQLSTEEKEQILTLRSEFKKIRQAKKDIGLEQPFKEMTKEELTDEQIEFLNDSRTQSIQLLLEAKNIAEKHKDEIESLFENLSEFETWKREMIGIAFKGRKSGNLVINSVFKSNLKRVISKSDLKNVMFLLWDPNNQLSFFQ
nr:hypothetical protein [uncultured Carboxylicivirga sp.]